MFDSSHWYDTKGKPAYEVPSKSGAMRSTTLADARKLNLVPSVTTILNVLAKPALTNWKVEQGILAALTMPRIEGETEKDYLRRIMSDSEKQVTDAADEGTRIHDALESHYKGRVVEHRYRPHVEGVAALLAKLFPHVEDWVSEASFCHPLGYGGKVDLHSPSTGIVVDFKGKDGDFTDGKKLAYDQHYQLSAYQSGLYLPCVPSANVFFSRTHPGQVTHHLWSAEDMEDGRCVFEGALKVWQAIKKYKPFKQAA